LSLSRVVFVFSRVAASCHNVCHTHRVTMFFASIYTQKYNCIYIYINMYIYVCEYTYVPLLQSLVSTFFLFLPFFVFFVSLLPLCASQCNVSTCGREHTFGSHLLPLLHSPSPTFLFAFFSIFPFFLFFFFFFLSFFACFRLRLPVLVCVSCPTCISVWYR